MAQTFDIRFARTAGLAALLEVPENRFRWKGGGLLSIDAKGISIGVKRGLLALSGGKRTQRIPSENLRAVYREGEALRVEYQDGEKSRTVLPFWADNRETAAQIVRLLPTTETVEIEHITGSSGKPRADWRVLLSMGAALAAIVLAAAAVYQRSKLPIAAAPVEAPVSMPMPDATASLVETPEPGSSKDLPLIEAPTAAPKALEPETAAIPDFLEPAPVVLPPLSPLPLPRDYVRSEDFVIPIERGTAAYGIAIRELTTFERDSAQLEIDYRVQRDLLESTALTAEEFAARLDALEMRWWEVTFRIFDNDALAGPALLDVRATMLAAARLWRGFLSTYAKGLRQRDHVMIASAFDELARAQEMQSRARLFVR